MCWPQQIVLFAILHFAAHQDTDVDVTKSPLSLYSFLASVCLRWLLTFCFLPLLNTSPPTNGAVVKVKTLSFNA